MQSNEIGQFSNPNSSQIQTVLIYVNQSFRVNESNGHGHVAIN